MNAVHSKPTKEAYKSAIKRMLDNIDDVKLLGLIYKYIVYLYTRKH